MAMGLIGTKCGMTRVFLANGNSVPVTVLLIKPNRVVQLKESDRHGYQAIQVTTGTCRRSRIKKPQALHFAKANVEVGRGLWEFRLAKDDATDTWQVGGEINVDIFKDGQYVDVVGTSKGKGWAGTIKRHNFSSQRMTHGNSLSHRAPGSIGQNQTPRRVFKGKKMAGRLGGKRCSVKHLQVVRVDSERNLLLIKGAIPGAPGGDVIVKLAKSNKGERHGA